MKYFKNYIAGKEVKSKANKYFKNINPANIKEVLGYFPQSTKSDINLAVNTAQEAYSQWRDCPAPKKGEIFLKIADLLTKEKENLALLMTNEMGKTISETLAEVQEAIDTVQFYAGEGRRLYGATTPSELNDKFCMTVRRPIGVCGIITPWNFPVAVPSWKMFPALILGNTLVWKPAEDAPLSGQYFLQICERAGLPKGVVNIVHGLGGTGWDLVSHPKVNLISFTGSTQTGALIASECGKRLKRYSLEMGGKNAQIIMQDSNFDLALDGALWGAFGTSGQRCTATSRILVQDKIYQRFSKALAQKAKTLRMGSGVSSEVDLGPLINKKQLSRVMQYIRIGKKEGAKLILGGKQLKSKEFKNGFYIEPTIFVDVKPSFRIAQEEIFGPVVSLIKFKTFEEAIEIANQTKYGLSSSIYTNKIDEQYRAINHLEAGMTYINSPSIGAEVHLPFGGVKQTGSGHREAGEAALDIFSEWKTVYVDYSNRLQKAQVD